MILGRRGMGVALLASVVTVLSPARATADVPACYTVRRGDTAALISGYLTGSVEHAYAPWFQIVDTARSRVVPKSHYTRIEPGWYACIPSSRLRVELRHSSSPMPRAAAPGRQPKTLAEIIPTIAGWGAAFMVMLLIADAFRRYVARRRAVVSLMQQFGERFVCEFERPLMEPGCLERPVESRLRVIPGRKRLEILLAPTGWRRYPNLSDHRRNLTYDADRVARLLKDERFVSGQLGAHGRWVVITCHFRMQAEQKGTK